MIKIKIHQASNDNFIKYMQEQCEVHCSAMGPYLTGKDDFPDKLNNLIALGYYDSVIEKEINNEQLEKAHIDKVLAHIFEEGNLNEDFCEELPRYISVLDIIEIAGNKKYIVMPIGFKEVKGDN